MQEKILLAEDNPIYPKARVKKGIKPALILYSGLLVVLFAGFAAYIILTTIHPKGMAFSEWDGVPTFQSSPLGINGQCQATWSPDGCKAEDITAVYVATSQVNGDTYLNFRLTTNAAKSLAGVSVMDGSFQTSAYIECNPAPVGNQPVDRIANYRPDVDNVTLVTADRAYMVWGSFGPHGNDSLDGQSYSSDVEWRVPVKQLPSDCQKTVGVYFTTSYYGGSQASSPAITDSTQPPAGKPLKKYDILTGSHLLDPNEPGAFDPTQKTSGAGLALLSGAILFGLYWKRGR